MFFFWLLSSCISGFPVYLLFSTCLVLSLVIIIFLNYCTKYVRVTCIYHLWMTVCDEVNPTYNLTFVVPRECFQVSDVNLL